MRKFIQTGQLWTAFLIIDSFRANSAFPVATPTPVFNFTPLHYLSYYSFFSSSSFIYNN